MYSQKPVKVLVFHFTISVVVGAWLLSIVTRLQVDNQQIVVCFPAGAVNFCLLCYVQTSSGAHPAFSLIGAGGPFSLWVKWSGHETEHSH
jgi:hypothetical protein